MSIRFYEKSRLIEGKHDESVKSNNYFHYDDVTIEKLEFISDAKSVGFTIKEIAENKRDAVFDLIHQVAASVSIVIVPASEVDSRGVHAANLDGMRRAVQGLSVEPAYVLTDGYAIEGLGVPNLAVWKGDQVVVSISAASVIAKVTRDRIMREMDLEFPLYGFAGHKGYITAAHTKALNEHGPCEQHRRSFANVAALIHK